MVPWSIFLYFVLILQLLFITSIGGYQVTETEIDAASVIALFLSPSDVKGSSRRDIEDDSIKCYCEGFINGQYHDKANSMEELHCESGSWVKCPKGGGCLKNTYVVRDSSFVIKFCGGLGSFVPKDRPSRCTVRRANSTVFGSVELNECRCMGNLCNKSVHQSIDIGGGSGVKWLVASVIVIFRLHSM